MSKLEIILGTMFSGKTTYLINKLILMAELNFKILYININLDNRSENKFSTHNTLISYENLINKENIKKNVTMIKIEKDELKKIEYKDYDIIMIDEGQFFNNIIETVKKILKEEKEIYIASLKGDFKGEKFGEVIDLIPISDNVIILNAICAICAKEKIKKNAIYSKRIENDNKEKIYIGGGDKYMPVCRCHYNE
jgi:thymidine kinase